MLSPTNENGTPRYRAGNTTPSNTPRRPVPGDTSVGALTRKDLIKKLHAAKIPEKDIQVYKQGNQKMLQIKVGEYAFTLKREGSSTDNDIKYVLETPTYPPLSDEAKNSILGNLLHPTEQGMDDITTTMQKAASEDSQSQKALRMQAAVQSLKSSSQILSNSAKEDQAPPAQSGPTSTSQTLFSTDMDLTNFTAKIVEATPPPVHIGFGFPACFHALIDDLIKRGSSKDTVALNDLRTINSLCKKDPKIRKLWTTNTDMRHLISTAILYESKDTVSVLVDFLGEENKHVFMSNTLLEKALSIASKNPKTADTLAILEIINRKTREALEEIRNEETRTESNMTPRAIEETNPLLFNGAKQAALDDASLFD